MDIFQVIILSVIEGISEFLPISSTAHLVLTSNILSIPETDFLKSFVISIQFGAILAPSILYFKSFIFNKKVLTRIVVSFIPTAVIGFVFYSLIKEVLIGNVLITLIALFIGGILLIIFEKLFVQEDTKLKKIEDISLPKAALLGVFQSVSMVPGVSRAAATILGGMFVGMDRKSAVEYSFVLAVPTMLAATLLDLSRNSFSFESSELLLLIVGFVGAFLSALIAVRFLLKYIQKNTFVSFGVYRIILALLYWFLVVT